MFQPIPYQRPTILTNKNHYNFTKSPKSLGLLKNRIPDFAKLKNVAAVDAFQRDIRMSKAAGYDVHHLSRKKSRNYTSGSHAGKRGPTNGCLLTSLSGKTTSHRIIYTTLSTFRRPRMGDPGRMWNNSKVCLPLSGGSLTLTRRIPPSSLNRSPPWISKKPAST